MYFCLKLPSASSWGCELKYSWMQRKYVSYSQPLREAVSWNTSMKPVLSLTSRQPLREAVSWNEFDAFDFSDAFVSLFVRLWVEIVYVRLVRNITPSASSWGCELKSSQCRSLPRTFRQPLREAVSWNMTSHAMQITRLASASSWGCELK